MGEVINKRLSLKINGHMANIFDAKRPKRKFSLISKANTYRFWQTNDLHQKPNNMVYVKETCVG
jgi:hypothetical protein